MLITEKELNKKVKKALEENRAQGRIGSAQEAKVLLSIEDKDAKAAYDKLSDYNKYMLFIVSAAEYVEENDFNKYEICKVKVVKDEGVKCERCWNRVPASLVVDCLCPRCKKIMDDFIETFRQCVEHIKIQNPHQVSIPDTGIKNLLLLWRLLSISAFPIFAA